MRCAEKHFFTQEHFEQHKGLSSASLCELVVHCLELVSQLAFYQLSFRFKGGNSLLILLENPQRFSIDVDIVSTESKEKLNQLAEKIVLESGVFTRVESRAPKTKPWLPMISFKFFFNSFYQKEEDAYVMLDVVLEEPPYPGEKKPIRCLDIYQSSYIVEVPTVSGLIGDKMLTIGPKTLGIPLGKNKEAQRLKHIFDISQLAKKKVEIDEVRLAIRNCMAQENRIQQKNCNWKEIKEDTLLFCSQALDYPEKPELEKLEPNTYLFEIVKGFDEFKQHLFQIDYSWPLFQENCKTVIAILEKLD